MVNLRQLGLLELETYPSSFGIFSYSQEYILHYLLVDVIKWLGCNGKTVEDWSQTVPSG